MTARTGAAGPRRGRSDMLRGTGTEVVIDAGMTLLRG